MFFVSVLRTIFFALDRLIYGMIPRIYDLIVKVSVLDLFEGKIDGFAKNIYALLALFMLFRLAFSLITTVVNPDLLTDQNQGFGKIIQRSMIALALIVLIPFIFSYGFRIQRVLIDPEGKRNIFMRIFMGTNETNISAGQEIGKETLSSFLKCNKDAPSYCENELNELLEDITNLSAMQEVLNDKIRMGDDFKYEYLWIFSLAAGGFVLIMLLVYSLDIAVRTVKLAFLQMIAPIAVMSYIDPKSSESGFFSKWQKLSVDTYVLLFLRMAAIAFMVFAFDVIQEEFVNLKEEGFFLKILVIVGLLLFAKDVPKMIADLFGVEDMGFGTLGKALKGAASFGTGLALGGAATALGGIAGGITGGIEGGSKSILGGAWSGIKSGAGGVWGAKGNVLGQGKAALTSPFKTVGDVGKGIKGEGYRWGLGRTADKWQAEAQRGAYLKQQKDDEKATNDIWKQMFTAEKDAENRGEDSMGQAMAKINAEQNAYDSASFINANRNYQALKEQLKYASNDFAVTENKFRTGSLSEDKYTEELIKFKKLEGSAKTAEERFTTVKKAHKKDGEMYDLIRAREDAEKVTKAAGAATSSSSSTKTTGDWGGVV